MLGQSSVLARWVRLAVPVLVCSNSGVLLLHADLCHAQPQSPSVLVPPPNRHHPPLSSHSLTRNEKPP